jgi:von Willebrand factor type A domain
MVLASVAASVRTSATPAAVPVSLEVELAFDTTSSMAQSIEAAKRDVRAMIEGVQRAAPGARFAVVSFRDFQNPAGEYEVLQPLTSDAGLVQGAIDRLRTVGNPAPGNVAAESYNLMFRRSHTDQALGWSPESRKIVVVFGDAEAHGAGKAGLAGCIDTTTDPHGLNTASELSALRAAKRTLVLIRQNSPNTTATLACYRSLAARGYAGGAARDAGSGDLGMLVVRLVTRAVAPLHLRQDVAVTLRGGSDGYTARVVNPNSTPVAVSSLVVRLPSGFVYVRGSSTGVTRRNPSASGRTLTWRLGVTLAPNRAAALHFNARATRRLGRYSTSATAVVGDLSTPAESVTTRVAARVRRLAATISAATRSTSIRGGLTLVFPARGRPFARGELRRASLTLARSNRRVRLTGAGFRVVRFGAETVLRLNVRVAGGTGLGACRPGTTGTIRIRNSGALSASTQPRDEVVVRLGGPCARHGGRFANAGSSRASVTIAAM